MSLGAEFLKWAIGTFGPIAADRRERALRFVEEAIELAHAEGVDRPTLEIIVARVYSAAPGALGRELGQAAATLEMLAVNAGYSAGAQSWIEFDRVRSLPKSHWTKRHSAKVKLGIAT